MIQENRRYRRWIQKGSPYDLLKTAVNKKLYEKFIKRYKAGKPTPTPKGFGQVEGDGTKPTDFEKDRGILKDSLLEFSKLPIDFDFAPHPYFGEMKYSAWTSLAAYHMNHHLEQFNV